jgi:hypothetical protein
MKKPIAFYPELAIELGDIASAIYYQQLYYWSDKGKRSDGFIYKTQKEIEEETTLTREQQDRIRKNLISNGWIEVKKIKANGHPTLHYKPLKEIGFSICGKDTVVDVGNTQKEMCETHKCITKNTTENTSDISNAGIAGEDISKIIDAFKEINPSYKKWFGNNTQRSAAARLIETHGLELTIKYIEALKYTNAQPYAPTVTTVLQLEDKLADLKAWSDKVKNKSETQKYKPIKIIEV